MSVNGKKWIGYVVILVPIIIVAIKWRVWNGGIGGLILALIAVFNCVVWTDIYEQRKKKKTK